MVHNYIFIIIALIISTVSVFNIFFLCNYINILYFEKNTNIYAYKITNMAYTLGIILSYIGVFVVLIYYLRLLNLGYFLDLKIVYLQIKVLWTLYFIPLSVTSKLYLTGLCLIISMFFLVMFKLFHKHILKEIMKLFVYIDGNPLDHNGKDFYWRLWHLKITDHFKYFEKDILSLLFNSYVLYKIMYYMHGPFSSIKDIKIFNKYAKYEEYITIFIQFSPFVVICYDCIFNNFVIIHFYYYMVVYIPIMLYKRLGKIIGTYTISKTLWYIYYDPDKNNKYIVDNIQKMFIELVIRGDLKIPVEFIMEATDTEILYHIQYRPRDTEQNIYWNNYGDYLRLDGGKIYEIISDDTYDGADIYKELNDYYIL